MAITTYYKNLVLNNAVQGTAINLNRPLAIGWWTADPTAAGLMSGEVASGEYFRQTVSFNSSYQSNEDLLWPVTYTGWGTISYGCLLDSATKGAGNMLLYGTVNMLSVPNTFIRIPAGQITLGLT